MSNIIDVKAAEQYKKDYQEYALYVNRHRMIPEFRDGLKPVQRRIVYAAYNDSHASELLKSATIVGATMGHYHPHGDSSIQGALYTLINWFNTKMPLFDGRGTFGNTNGDAPAAMRYTESKISKFTFDCILDELIQCKEVVDWEPTFDNKMMEPMYLPCKVPLLLINGNSNIAVGDKIDIPSHNINEVIDATINAIKNPNYEVVLAPDHCQRCDIVDTDWVSICRKGYGLYKVRGIIEIGTYKGANKKYNGLTTLNIRSCPNMVYLKKIVQKIEDMVKNNKIIGILDIEEQSQINDMNFVIVLKPGTDPNFIRSELYKNTAMETTGRVNMKVIDVLDKNEPIKRLSYTGFIKAWIMFRKLTKLRFYENKLQRLNTRLHVIENYIWAIESGKSEEAIAIIKKQKTVNDNDLIEILIKKLNVTDLQAKFFINCEIKKLSKGYLDQFKNEKIFMIDKAQFCRDAILIDGRIDEIIIQELLEIKSKYGSPRLCKLIKESEANGIPSGTFKLVITENNFIKKIGLDDNITGIRPNDPVKFVITGDNDKSLLLFDNMGKVFNLPICKIPFSDKNSSGVDIRILNKYINSTLTCIIYEPIISKFKKGCIVTLTKSGYIKRMSTTDFLSVPLSGLVYSKVDQDDSIIDVLLFNGNADIVVYTKNKSLRMQISEIPLLKRNARGNISMGGTNTTEVEGLSVIQPDTTDIIIVTSKGYFNKISPECVKSGRTKAGSNVIKLGKGDSIVTVLGANAQNILKCITIANGEIFDIPVNTIPTGSSISTGSRLIPAKAGSVAKVQIAK